MGLGLLALSGRPDIAIPLVMAGEAAYLGLLGTHPKFQDYVEAQEAKKGRHSVFAAEFGSVGEDQAVVATISIRALLITSRTLPSTWPDCD